MPDEKIESQEYDFGGRDVEPPDWGSVAEADADAGDGDQVDASPDPATEESREVETSSVRGDYPDPETATPEELMKFFKSQDIEEVLGKVYRERYDQYGRAKRAERERSNYRSQLAAYQRQQEARDAQILQLLEMVQGQQQQRPEEEVTDENVTEWFRGKMNNLDKRLDQFQQQAVERERAAAQQAADEKFVSHINAEVESRPEVKGAFDLIAATEINDLIEDRDLTEEQAAATFYALAKNLLFEKYSRGVNIGDYILSKAAGRYGFRIPEKNGAKTGKEVSAQKIKERAKRSRDQAALSRGGAGGRGSATQQLNQKLSKMSDAEWRRMREQEGPSSVWDQLANDEPASW